MKAVPSEKFDFITSLASANTFHAVAKGCLNDYKKNNQISPTIVFASATNYGLSIELYLKTLIIMEGREKPHGHDLDILYNKLTTNLQHKINRKYQLLNGEDRKETLYLKASLENSNPDNLNNMPERGTKLKQLLKNNKDIFIMYRYMFERGRQKKWEYFYFEYGNFDLVCEALKIIANDLLSDKEQLKVKRT